MRARKIITEFCDIPMFDNHMVFKTLVIGIPMHACVLNSLQKAEEVPPPKWLEKIKVPSEDRDLEQLTSIGNEISKLETKYSALNDKILKETQIKKLLYEKNKSLENIVKESFEELGFSCKKKDDEDWIISSELGEGILEVTGSEGTIDIQKLRQLLNYLLDENKETEGEKKAILVANHFLEMPIEKRGAPFSKKVIDESSVHSICLLPTTELFSLICDIRNGKTTTKEAQKRILGTSGLFASNK